MKKSIFKKNKDNKTPWVKYYKDVPAHLEYSKGSIYDYLEENSLKRLDLPAYDYFGTVVTFDGFLKKINTAAKAFKAIGVKENDCVTICMPNTPEGLIAFYAVSEIGAIANMIHPLSAEKEIEFYINKAKSSIIVTTDIAYDKIMRIESHTSLEHIIVVPIDEEMPLVTKFMYKVTMGRKTKYPERTDKVLFWHEFDKIGSSFTGSFRAIKDKNDPAVILYSGGTTGNPKGILLSSYNFNSLALQSHLMCDPSKEGDTILAIMPIFHGFGLGVCTHTTLCLGMKLYLLPTFSPKKFASIIKKYKPSFIAGVPTLFETMITSKDLEKEDLSYIRCLVSGGDVLPPKLKYATDKFVSERGSHAQLRAGYGLTEGCGASCLVPTDNYREDSIGIPFPDVIYKIVKVGTHDECAPNEEGEICISGPTVMLGYLDDEDETALALRVHEDNRVWLHTGDIGCMDEEGFVYFKQRLKRIIISSGYNIYPTYVEGIINNHPDVATCTVIGVDHPHKVQVAKAFIVLKPNVELTEKVKKSIKDYCIENLAQYTIPYSFEYRESLPKTLVGKIAYSKLIEEEKNKK